MQNDFHLHYDHGENSVLALTVQVMCISGCQLKRILSRLPGWMCTSSTSLCCCQERKSASQKAACVLFCLTLLICCCKVKVLHLFGLFMRSSEVRQIVATPFCLGVRTITAITNGCNKVLFKHVLFFNFIKEKKTNATPNKLHYQTINLQKCILPPGV